MKLTSKILLVAPLDRLIKWREEELERASVSASLWLRAIEAELRERGIDPQTGMPK